MIFMDKISYSDFDRLEIVCGRIVSAEAVLGSEKMLKLEVDIGPEKRLVMAGIAKNHAPDGLVGRKIAFLANIAPRKVMGIESNGMVLAASDEEGNAVLLNFEKEVKEGGRVR